MLRDPEGPLEHTVPAARPITFRDLLTRRAGVGTVRWPGAYGTWWQADPNDGSVLVFLSHTMVDPSQLGKEIGLDTWSAIATFHRVCA